MNENGAGIRSDTLALDALIQKTIEHAEEEAVDPSANALLFLGNRHASFPALVVQDPILEPVDKLVWMSIRLQADESSSNTAFPSYAYIAKTANVSSTTTIARGIAILRITRWLTLCARVRSASGRFQGNVFALHDEPLPLVDAIYLDDSYMQFLHASVGHHHARVKAVACGVLDTIDEDIQAGRDVCIDEHPMIRRVQAAEVVEKDMPRRFFSFSAKVMADLRSYSPGRSGRNHQNQNLKPVDFHANITVGTDDGERKKTITSGAEETPLVYPRRLSDNQRELANHYLNIVPLDQRQAVLDELEGRIRSEQRGMAPLYDELSFLHSLCKALRNGEFKFNLGVKVRDERIAREKAHQKRLEECKGRPADNGLEVLRKQIKAGKGPIAEMRKALGMRSRPATDTDPNKSSSNSDC